MRCHHRRQKVIEGTRVHVRCLIAHKVPSIGCSLPIDIRLYIFNLPEQQHLLSTHINSAKRPTMSAPQQGGQGGEDYLDKAVDKAEQMIGMSSAYP